MLGIGNFTYLFNPKFEILINIERKNVERIPATETLILGLYINAAFLLHVKYN